MSGYLLKVLGEDEAKLDAYLKGQYAERDELQAKLDGVLANIESAESNKSDVSKLRGDVSTKVAAERDEVAVEVKARG